MSLARRAVRQAAIGARYAAGFAGLHWPALAVAVTPVLLFWSLLFSGRVLFWGLPLLQFYPWRWLALQQVRAGVLPLWNPYLGSGAPLLANYQTAVFYPPNWLAYLPGVPLDYSLGLVAVLHIAWAGLGMVAFARAIGLHDLGQAVTALAFSLSGYLVARLGFLTIIAAAAWLPWLLWAGERLTQTLAAPRPTRPAPRRRLAARLLTLSGLMALQLLAGHAQTTLYSIGLATLWVLWRSVHRLKSALLFSLSIVFALCLTAVQLLPTFELLRQSPRAEAADYDFVVTYSLWPWRFLTFAAPDAFGSPARANYWGYGNYWEDAAYVGVLPLGLAVLAVIDWVRRRFGPRSQSLISHPGSLTPDVQALVPFLTAIAAISLIFALGRNTPVLPFLYRHVPTFDLFQAPARMTIGFVTAVTILAGIGTEVWRRPAGQWLSWTKRGIAGALGVMVAAGLAAFFAPGRAAAPLGAAAARVFETFPRALAIAGILAAISLGLSLARPAGGRRRWEGIVAAFIAFDLIAAGYSLNPAIHADLYRRPTSGGASLWNYLNGHRLYQFANDEYRSRQQRFFRFDRWGSTRLEDWLAAREAQLPNLGLVEGIASANNFDPLIPARYAALLDALQRVDLPQAWTILRMMDVQAVVSATPMPGMVRILAGEGYGVYAVPRPAARIRIAYFLQMAQSPEQAFRVVTDPAFEPDTASVIEMPEPAFGLRPQAELCRSGLFDRLSRRNRDGTVGAVVISGATLCQSYADSVYGAWNRSVATLAGLTESAGPGGASVMRDDMPGPFAVLASPRPGKPILLTESSTHIRIAAPMEFSGYVVLGDAYYPGWQAYVDGQPVPLVPANFAFRAVFVPIGQHIVEFRYEPFSFRAGSALSAAAWLAYCALAVFLGWKRSMVE